MTLQETVDITGKNNNKTIGKGGWQVFVTLKMHACAVLSYVLVSYRAIMV